ncbi:hypothetical protein IE53DRAFT_274767 [Violaceomyces palustris]|uniref:Uncharacterized protein n=1 Tax=Violaceomyces palustris TaxID=1673888 RepID=A0ACD0NMK2_9BASI|nr:hypothetical protein IE53DRAFT_274767 [Violaceomyces palustris]
MDETRSVRESSWPWPAFTSSPRLTTTCLTKSSKVTTCRWTSPFRELRCMFHGMKESDGEENEGNASLTRPSPSGSAPPAHLHPPHLSRISGLLMLLAIVVVATIEQILSELGSKVVAQDPNLTSQDDNGPLPEVMEAEVVGPSSSDDAASAKVDQDRPAAGERGSDRDQLDRIEAGRTATVPLPPSSKRQGLSKERVDVMRCL